jgi:hypothetical protein
MGVFAVRSPINKVNVMRDNSTVVRPESEPSFLRKHRRWFSFLSPIILLGTFVVNEGLRDKAKDLAQSIALAQSTWVERAEVGVISRTSEYIARAVDNICKSIHGRGGNCKPLNTLEDADISVTDPNKAYFLRSVRAFDNAMALYRKLPYDKELDDMHWALVVAIAHKQKMVDAQDFFDNLMKIGKLQDAKEFYKSAEWLRRDQITDSARLQTVFHVRPEFAGGIDIPIAVDAFGDRVVARAEQAGTSADGRANLWTKISYGLYPFGLLIGVLGKLAGDDSSFDD